MKLQERQELTQERLKEVLEYDLETGIFTWKMLSVKNQRKVGDVAGSISAEGYCKITIDTKSYPAHRLVWLYVHGENPLDMIDHIDGDKLNNRVGNLRQANQLQNMKNQKRKSTNKSGFKGVSWKEQSGRWVAQACINYKVIYLGLFDTPEEASEVYNAYVSMAHGEFYRDTVNKL